MDLLYNDERLIDNPKIDSQIQNEHKHRYRTAAMLVGGKRVLDAACGSGYGSAILAGVAESVVGIDYSKEVIEYCNSLYNIENLTYRQMSASELDFPADSFDVVISFETLEHLKAEDQLRFLEGIKRVLTKDGILIMSSPNKDVWGCMVNGEVNDHHLNELDKKQFEELLGKYFPNIKMFYQNCLPVSFIVSDDKASQMKKVVSENYKGTDMSAYSVAVCSEKPVDIDLSGIYIPDFEQTHFEKIFNFADMSLYCDCGEGFVEKDKLHAPIRFLKDGRIAIDFTFRKDTKAIRLDPGELPCVLGDFSVSQKELVCAPYNGKVLENGDFKFYSYDPIVSISGGKQFKKGETLSFTFFYSKTEDELLDRVIELQGEATALKAELKNASDLLDKERAENNSLLEEKTQEFEKIIKSYSSLAQKYLKLEKKHLKLQGEFADYEGYYLNLLKGKDDFFNEVVGAKDTHITNIEAILSNNEERFVYLDKVIYDKDVHITNLENIIETLNNEIYGLNEHAKNLNEIIGSLQKENATYSQRLNDVYQTVSWKLTAPLRKARGLIRRVRKNV